MILAYTNRMNTRIFSVLLYITCITHLPSLCSIRRDMSAKLWPASKAMHAYAISEHERLTKKTGTLLMHVHVFNKYCRLVWLRVALSVEPANSVQLQLKQQCRSTDHVAFCQLAMKNWFQVRTGRQTIDSTQIQLRHKRRLDTSQPMRPTQCHVEYRYYTPTKLYTIHTRPNYITSRK